MNYHFQKVNEMYAEGSRICSIYDDPDTDYKTQTVMPLGQLKARFGEPDYLSENLEEQFSYTIAATDEAGNTLLLNAYSGSTGPAIGGQNGAEYEQAATALAAYIRQTKPVDYDYEGYYLDDPCKVKMGIKDGDAYLEEEELNLSEEEMEDLFQRLY